MRHNHVTGTIRVLELGMVALAPATQPAFLFKSANDFSAVHSHNNTQKHTRSVFAFCLSFLLTAFPVLAAAPDWTTHFRERFPATAISVVRETPIPGLFEIIAGNNVIYADESGRYLFFGRLWDAQAQKDLSAEALESLAPPENPAPELPAPKGE